MRDFHVAVDINAPPDRVWQIMRDIERWPEWTSTVTSVRRLDSGPFDVGSIALIHQPKLLPAKWHVAEYSDDDRRFTWITKGPGLRVTARHSVEAIGDGSRANLSLEYSGLSASLIARLTRNINESYLAIEAKGLKERAESGSGVARASGGS